MPDLAAKIADNLAAVRLRIAEAARRAGRAAEEITLVGVTKYVTPQIARPLAESGCLDLGENRPQSLWQKAEAFSDLPVRWHLIGSLQRNKVKRTVAVVARIHSVDSVKLYEAVACEAAALGKRVPCLLEVKVAADATKHGFAPEELAATLAALPLHPAAPIDGLMTMASLEGGLDQARRDFDALRNLRDRLRADLPSGVTLDELSMGMSGDFEAAIEAGATLVRVGSALFEDVV